MVLSIKKKLNSIEISRVSHPVLPLHHKLDAHPWPSIAKWCGVANGGMKRTIPNFACFQMTALFEVKT